MSSIWSSIERFNHTDCLVGKDFEIKKKKDFSSINDDEIEYEVIKYAEKNGYNYITICPRTVYFKRSDGYTDEDINNQLNENKTNPRYGRCKVIHINFEFTD
jgi:hypothetical protein